MGKRLRVRSLKLTFCFKVCKNVAGFFLCRIDGAWASAYGFDLVSLIHGYIRILVLSNRIDSMHRTVSALL